MARRGRPRHPDILTPREWDVLALLREGLSNEQIAARLGITERAAKFHVAEILSKLGVGSREEAAAWQPEERRPWWLALSAPFTFVARKIAGPAGHGMNAAGVAISGAMLATVAAGIILLALLLSRGGSKSTPIATGEHIAFSFQGSIYTVRPDGGDLRRALQGGAAPEFSPDGAKIAYLVGHRVVVATSDFAATLADVDLFVDRRPTPPTADDWSMGPIAVHWSRDSKQLLITRQRLGGSGASDVVLMDADGGNWKIVLQSGLFIEATWTQPDWPKSPSSGSEPIGPDIVIQEPKILIVGADGGLSGKMYDLEGRPYAPAPPAQAIRSAVAAVPNLLTGETLVRSTLGSPESFGPIEIYAPNGTGRITAGGCAATWSPDGTLIAYYDGFGIAIKKPDASPDDRRLIVSNQHLGLPASTHANTSVCGGVGISWSTAEKWYAGGDSSNHFALAYPAAWIEGAPLRTWSVNGTLVGLSTCGTDCTVLGPQLAAYPYGVQVFAEDGRVAFCGKPPRVCGGILATMHRLMVAGRRLVSPAVMPTSSASSG